jgi:hypothetical protein
MPETRPDYRALVDAEVRNLEEMARAAADRPMSPDEVAIANRHTRSVRDMTAGFPEQVRNWRPDQATRDDQAVENFFVGVPEAATTVATSILGDAWGGTRGLFTLGADQAEEHGGTLPYAVKQIEHGQQQLTYVPRTAAGGRVLQGMGEALNYLLQPVRAAGDAYEEGAQSIDPGGTHAGVPYVAFLAGLEMLGPRGRRGVTQADNLPREMDIPEGYGGIGDTRVPDLTEPELLELAQLAERYDPNVSRAMQGGEGPAAQVTRSARAAGHRRVCSVGRTWRSHGCRRGVSQRANGTGGECS